MTDVAIIVIDHDQMSLRLLRTWTVGKLEIQALIATSDGWRRQMLKKSRPEAGPGAKGWSCSRGWEVVLEPRAGPRAGVWSWGRGLEPATSGG